MHVTQDIGAMEPSALHALRTAMLSMSEAVSARAQPTITAMVKLTVMSVPPIVILKLGVLHVLVMRYVSLQFIYTLLFTCLILSSPPLSLSHSYQLTNRIPVSVRITMAMV